MAIAIGIRRPVAILVALLALAAPAMAQNDYRDQTPDEASRSTR
jgi:hypothetical protein